MLRPSSPSPIPPGPQAPSLSAGPLSQGLGSSKATPRSLKHHQVCVQMAAVEPWSAQPVRNRQPHAGGQYALIPLGSDGKGWAGAIALTQPCSDSSDNGTLQFMACVECGKRAAFFRPCHCLSLSHSSNKASGAWRVAATLQVSFYFLFVMDWH